MAQPETKIDPDELLENIWRFCVGMICDDVDYPTYQHALRRQHELMPAAVRGEVSSAAMLAIGRMVWRQTPHPRLGYALAVAPARQRNEPCQCGSGRKYKHCCLPIEQAAPPAPEMNFLPLLLDCLPRRRWPELAGSQVPRDMVMHAAIQMNEAHEETAACALLEPWFVHDLDFKASREPLLDILLDAYSTLPRPRKKQQLIERAIVVGDRRIRSAALQRKASMLSDQGRQTAAWATFEQAQRADPDSPSLAHLEITLLFSEGRHAEARDRAKFWVRRLEGMRAPELAGLVDFLRKIADQGEQVVHQFMLDHQPDMRALLDALKAAPPVASHYTLEPDGDQCGPLKPDAALRKALRAWGNVAPLRSHSPAFGSDGADSDDIVAWLAAMQAHPVLWHAFEALDALVGAVRACNAPGFDERLARPLLARAEALLREVLRANGAEGRRLEWGWLENRPALSLLGERIAIDRDLAPGPEQIERLQWLVLTLNPDDNQGFRDWLVRAYLQSGRAADALSVCNRYPGDHAAMRYNRVLALHALGQAGKALAALHDAVTAYPRPLAWLLKTDPKPPRRGRYGIEAGGAEEAWLYRQDMQELWQQLDALDWLRDCARALGSSARG